MLLYLAIGGFLVKNLFKTSEENIENEYFLESRYLLDARLYLNYSRLDVSIEFISALCDIKYEEAEALVKNYRDDINNRNAYILSVAALLRAQEQKEYTR